MKWNSVKRTRVPHILTGRWLLVFHPSMLSTPSPCLEFGSKGPHRTSLSPTQTCTSSLTPPLCHSKSGRPVSQNMSCFTLLYKNTYIQNLMTYALLPENSYNFQFTDLFLKSHKAFQMTCFAMVIFRERSRIWGTFTVSGLLKSFILSLQQRKEKA